MQQSTNAVGSITSKNVIQLSTTVLLKLMSQNDLPNKQQSSQLKEGGKFVAIFKYYQK